jgi:alpha-L-arabinofuranosidase
VFAGEYACHGRGRKWNHFNAALLEAAFMTTIERNADIVHMSSYAPLFAHVEGWQWRPDMIWFDNMTSFRTCSYYVQQLYSTYKGTNALKMTMDGKNVTGADGQNGLFASAVLDKENNQYIVKVINVSETAQPLNIKFEGMKKNEKLSSGRVIKLQTDDVLKENSIENPNLITPKESMIEVGEKELNTIIEPQTFAVYILKK